MKSVLIISDDWKLAAALKAALWGNQSTFTTLSSHEHVVEELIPLKPDIILVDFLLNNNNGGSICHEIRGYDELQPLPLILLTDYPNVERFTAKFGCNAIIHKPITAFELVNSLSLMLQHPGLTPHFLEQAS